MENTEYFKQNGQDQDRPALPWFNRILQREVSVNNPVVLELGSGTGFLSRRIQKWATLVIVEPNLEFGEFEKKYYLDSTAKKYTNIEKCMEEVASESIDCVVALHVLEHISDLDAAVDFIKKILKPGGTLLLAVPDATGEAARLKGKGWSAFKDPTHVHFLGSSDWVRMILESGFKLNWNGTDGMWDIPYKNGKLRDFVRYFPRIILAVLLGRVCIPVGRGETYIGSFTSAID